MILVDPLHIGLCARKRKTILDELSRLEIELSIDVGIFPTIGETDEAKLVIGLKPHDAGIDPALLITLSESIEIENGFPVGRFR